MKTKIAAIILFLMTGLTLNVCYAEGYYYDDFETDAENLTFINEGGKAKLWCNTDEGVLSISTNALCYPQFWTPGFKVKSDKVIVEFKTRFIYGAGSKCTLKLDIGGQRETAAEIDPVYEWTVFDVLLDFKAHTASLYHDGSYVSERSFAQSIDSEKIMSSQLKLNIGHKLPTKEIQYDYITVFDKSDILNFNCEAEIGSNILTLKTSNPLSESSQAADRFALDGYKILKVSADSELPCTYYIKLNTALMEKKEYKLQIKNTSDIAGNSADTSVSFSPSASQIEISYRQIREKDEYLQFTAKCTNNTKENKKAVCFVNFYKTLNGKRVYCGFKKINIEIPPGSREYVFESECFKTPEKAETELFIWDDEKTMRTVY